MSRTISLDEAERQANGGRTRHPNGPTIAGARQSWLHLESGLVDISRWLGREPPEREWLTASAWCR